VHHIMNLRTVRNEKRRRSSPRRRKEDSYP
jgi:hypothetical protein